MLEVAEEGRGRGGRAVESEAERAWWWLKGRDEGGEGFVFEAGVAIVGGVGWLE